jgi:hypothetical protein
MSKWSLLHWSQWKSAIPLGSLWKPTLGFLKISDHYNGYIYLLHLLLKVYLPVCLRKVFAFSLVVKWDLSNIGINLTNEMCSPMKISPKLSYFTPWNICSQPDLKTPTMLRAQTAGCTGEADWGLVFRMILTI